MKTGGNAKYADRADGACRVRPPSDGGFELWVPIRSLAKCASYIIFFAIVCVATVPSSRAQGTLVFSTKASTAVDARVYQSDGITPVDGNFWGQLYAGPPGGQLAAVGVPVQFRSDAGIGYITAGGVIQVPGVAIEARADVKLVVWSKALGNTYEEAIAQNRGATGESNVITVTTGGDLAIPGSLVGLHGFNLRPAITYHEWQFANTNRISIQDNSSALDYPSLITVANLTGAVETVRIRLNQLEHNYPDDLDILLVAPNGKTVMVMSDAGGSQRLIGANLTFSDASAADILDLGPITSGAWRPKNYDPLVDAMPSPAPSAPHGTTFANLAGGPAAGTWKLYVADDAFPDSGSLSGWELFITTLAPTNLPPTIASQPQGQTANPGASVTFSIIATGTAPLYYQWRKDGVDIIGANGSTLVVDDVTVSSSGTYTVWVNNLAGETTSAGAVLTVLSRPPSITTQPQGQTANPGDTVSFSVIASGAEPLFYQWRKDGVDITGANDKTLVLDNVTASNSGTYAVWVNNVAGETTSAGAVLTVVYRPRPPTSISISEEWHFANTNRIIIRDNSSSLDYPSLITVSNLPNVVETVRIKLNALGHNFPDDIDVLLVAPNGKSVIVMSDAGGDQPVVSANLMFSDAAATDIPDSNPLTSGTWRPKNYDGLLDAMPSPAPPAPHGATFANLAGEHADGTWKLYIVDDTLSDSGSLSGWELLITTLVPTNIPPTIASQPQEQTANPGAKVTFSIIATGTAPLYYQWRKDGVDITGANSPTLVLDDVTVSSSGTYTVWVNNLAGETTSAGAVLTVLSRPPSITTQPQGQTANPGDTVSLSVLASGTEPLFYQWRKDGVDITGANDKTLVLDKITESTAGTYTVWVNNVAGQTTSTEAVLTVNRPPTIAVQPESKTANPGDTVSFAVVTSGTKPQFYQWRKDGVDIVGANSASLVLENITISSAGTYTVWVNNLVGDTTSTGAVLAVNSPPVITAQPESQTVSPGESVVFAVAALGTPPLAYQWLKNGINIEGATGASLVLSNVTSSEASSYSVRVSNVAGVRTSAGAILNVRIILSFQQLNYSVAENAGTIRIGVRKQGTGVATVNYSTGGGTAEIGRDYWSANGNLRFGVNDNEQQISIELLDDYVLDGSKSIQLRLVAPSENAALGEFSTAILTIQDNDAAIADQGFLKLIFPESRPVLNASLQVLLDPDRLGGWRFSWETLWRPSLDTATRLEPGNYDLEFRPVAGYLAPGKAPVSLLAGPTTRRLFHYVSNATSRAGSLSVNIEPLDQLRDGQLFPGWKIQGEEAYRESNTTTMDLPAGPHIVTFKDVDGWIAPSPRVVTVLPDVENAITAAYLVAPPLPSGFSQPQVLRSYQAIRDGLGSSPILPYSLCGELRTSVGYGSGVAVRERVVLTAAHVLFDEGTTNFVSEVEWFHERHAGEYDPKPLRAQGWYVFTNYLDARRLERASGLKPGQSGPASRQWDVAAVYFAEAVARGGQSGYLLSTNEVNDWLFSSELKTLIGYPLNGSERDHRMHTLLPGNYGFLPPSLAAPSVYSSTEFGSAGGNSGGPFCVNHRQSDGFQAFFPAAVYLGSDGTRSLVRAIDRDVATLINRAASSAELGTNFTGGGVISFSASGSGFDLLSFQTLAVQLGPPDAVLSGAAWRVREFPAMTFTNAGRANVELTAGIAYAIEFRPVPGYSTPALFPVTLAAGQDATLKVSYEPIEAPRLFGLPGAGIFVSGPAGARVVIEYRSTFAEGSRWIQVETNTLSDQPRRILGPPWPANAVGFYRARREE